MLELQKIKVQTEPDFEVVLIYFQVIWRIFRLKGLNHFKDGRVGFKKCGKKQLKNDWNSSGFKNK